MTPLHEVIINKKTSTNPIWIMRQAGRYLPEFREIRKENSDFIKLCLNEKLSSEITLQPIKRFNITCQIKGLTSITLLSDKNSFKYFLMSNQFVESGVPRFIIKTPVLPKLIGG